MYEQHREALGASKHKVEAHSFVGAETGFTQCCGFETSLLLDTNAAGKRMAHCRAVRCLFLQGRRLRFLQTLLTHASQLAAHATPSQLLPKMLLLCSAWCAQLWQCSRQQPLAGTVVTQITLHCCQCGLLYHKFCVAHCWPTATAAFKAALCSCHTAPLICSASA